ncbi:MAG: hypothetical protein WC551_08490 [Patescibacteria group bacterium]
MKLWLDKICLMTSLICLLCGSSDARISAGNIDSSYAIERVSVSRDGRAYAWDRKGDGIAGWPIDFAPEGFKVILEPRLVDVNRDGRAEAVFVLRSSSGTEQMRVLKGDGTELTGWRFDIPSSYGPIAHSPLIADINEDNRLEVAFATASGHVEVYRHAAGFSRLDDFCSAFDAAPHLLAADLENDGRSSLYAVIDADGEIILWEKDGEQKVFASLSSDAEFKGGAGIIDVDGDGKEDLIAGTSVPSLVAINHDGELFRFYPLPQVPTAPPIAADIDLDMQKDILVLLADRTVYAMNVNGSKVRKWDYNLPFEADSVDAGVVAFDLYDGLISSISGWDQTSIYKVSRDRFMALTLGENVHVYDRILAEMDMPVTKIEEVVVMPKVITPNDDGYNDNAKLSYILSTSAAITIDVLDSAGNEIYRALDGSLQNMGSNSAIIDGLNTKGTVTPNDDEPLPKGLYYLRVTALNDLGLSSRVMTPLIVFGMRAAIEFPADEDEKDAEYPTVYGTVNISGIATDPNIGEGNDNFDFVAYKVYYRPGAWEVEEDDALSAGDMGSPWLPVLVPIQDQSPDNTANEPADSPYPASNVSVRPVQHGLLAQWNTTDIAATPNGIYTLLLKVVDGNGNAVGRVNFDSIVVNAQNLSSDTPFDPSDPSTDPNDPENIGPVLTGITVLPGTISTQNPATTISYTLGNETSNVNIVIHKVSGGQTGPVVASFSQGLRSPGNYSFEWNGKDNLNKRVDVGYYRAQITAAAQDGTGSDVKTTSNIFMNVATEYNAGLAILGFTLSSSVFDPFDFVTDENGDDVLAEELTASYSLNRYARVTIGVYDESDELVRSLAGGVIDKIGHVSWNGADDEGMIVTSGHAYTVKIKAECIDAGCTDVIEDEAVVEIRALSMGGMGIVADVTMLIGEGDENGSTLDEIEGILHDDADILNDFPLNGSADFSWRAYGHGYIRVPFTYGISANGEESYYVNDTREAYVTPENVPVMTITGGLPVGCTIDDFRFDPNYSISHSLSFEGGFNITSYGYQSNTVPNGIVVNVTSPASTKSTEAPFSITEQGGLTNPSQVSFSLHLQGGQLGAGGLSQDDQNLIRTQCTHGNDISLCNSLGYKYNPDNAYYLFMCEYGDVPPEKMCGSWPAETNPVVTGPDAFVSPVTCGAVRLWANARKSMTRSWGPYASTGPETWLHSVTNPGAIHLSDYSGATSSGNPDVVSSWVTDYALSFNPTINGEAHPVSGTSGYLNVGGIIRAWLGTSSGPGAGGSMYADIMPEDFETTDDTKLSSNVCVFDGNKYINGTLDTAVQSDSKRCITAEVGDINEDYFSLDSGPYSIYASYPLNDHPLLYTFSDVVHVSDWTVDLRYPDGTVNDSFDVIDMSVNSSGTRDVDGDGTAESNKNTNDTFKLKLKSNAAPKRLVEVRGVVNGETWELRYFDANTNAWAKIAEGEGARNGTLAWWDVSRLNGRSYTVIVRAFDDTGAVASEDTMEVAIGTMVRANEGAVVTSPYRRYAIHFDEYSLCPEGGPYPCDSSINDLITVIPIPQDTPGLYIPSGINPIGPVIEIKPDGIELNSTYQPQLEVYFTRGEIEELYSQEPQEVKDYVFGITADDPSVMAIYNLKSDGELEQLATINTWDDRGTPGTADDIFRISGLLNHFSRYVVMKEDDGYPRIAIDSPAADDVVHGMISVSGSVGGITPDDPLSSFTVAVSAEDGESGETLFSGLDPEFNFSSNLSGRHGWQTILAKAHTASGVEATASVRVYVDNTAPHTQVVVNEQLVEAGGLAVVPPDSDIMLIAEDSVDRDSVVQEIRYRWDDGQYATYEGIIPLNIVEAGRHSFSCYAVDDQDNQEPEQTVYITIIDPGQPGEGASIETSLIIDEPTFSDGHQNWISGSTNLSMIAADGSQPVYQIRYSIGDDAYQLYEGPITLFGYEDGAYDIEYFGMDYYGLAENMRATSVVLDASSPDTTIQISGPAEKSGEYHYVAASTRFICEAEDGGIIPSGISRIEYSLDGGEWLEYGEPIGVAPGAGERLLSIRSVDRVGNIEEPHTYKLRFDADAPTLELISSSSHISPNGDGVNENATWRVRSSNVLGGEYLATLMIDGVRVDQYQGVASEIELSWDGRIGEALSSEGVHQYQIDLTDLGDHTAAPLSGQIIVDITPPAVSVASTTGSGGNVTLNYIVDDNAVAQNVAIQLSIYAGTQPIASVPQQVALPPQAHAIVWNGFNQFAAQAVDGQYRYTLTATDEAGNVSPAQAGILSLDIRPPSSRLVISGPSFEGGGFIWIGPSSQLLFAADDLAGVVDHIDYKFDGSDWQAYTTPFTVAASGAHTVAHRAVDAAGNEEEPKTRQISLDDIAPISTLNVEGVQKQIDGKTHWSGSATFIKLDTTDQGSGVSRSNFEIAAPKLIYEASQPVALGNIGDGEKTATYWSVDKVGNEEAKRQLSFVINGSPPDVSLDLGNPKFIAGSIIYIDGATPLQIIANSNSDDIVYLHYKIDDQPLVPSTSEGASKLTSQQFNIAEEGSHLVKYFAVDGFENRRELAMPLIVDNDPPLTHIEKSQEVNGDEKLATPSTVIRLNADDDFVGLKSTEYAFDGGQWRNYEAPFSLQELSGGQHDLSYRSTDLLGHVESAGQQLLDILVLNANLGRTALPRILMFVPTEGVENAVDPEKMPEVSEIADVCSAMGWTFKLVSDTASFLNAMRSDAFNIFAVTGATAGYRFEGSQLVDRAIRELELRIFKGDALMLLQGGLGIKGVAWERMLGSTGGLETETLESGRSRLYYPANGEDSYPSVALASGAYSIKGSVSPLFYADESVVVGKRAYGDGNVLFVGGDITSWQKAYDLAVLQGAYEKTWADMWDEVLREALGSDPKLSPGEVVSLELSLSTKERSAFVYAVPEVPSRAYWLSQDGSDATGGTSWSVDLAEDDSKTLSYSLRMPFNPETVDIPVVITTAWSVGLNDTSKKILRQDVAETWDKLWKECDEALQKLRDEPETLEGAWAMLDAMLAGWRAADAAGDLEGRIGIVLDSFEKLSVLEAEKTIDLKRNLVQLLQALELQVFERSQGEILPSESAVDSDSDGLPDDIEVNAGTDPFDADSDDDGVIDGRETAALEDSDNDGLINALDPDSDNDGLLDGLEMSAVSAATDPDGAGPIKCTDEEAGHLAFDSDPATTTNMTKADTDGGGLTDDKEDLNKNGRVDTGETDPNNPLDDTNPTEFAGGGGGGGCKLYSDQSGDGRSLQSTLVMLISIAIAILIKRRSGYRC